MKKVGLALFLVFSTLSAGAQVYLNEDFNSGMPANFVIQNGGNTADTWMTVPFHPENNVNRTLNGTPFLFCNGDLPDPATEMDEYLTTPVMNTDAAAQVFLQFSQVFRDYGATTTDSANIEIFDGSNWVKLLKQAGSSQGNWVVPKLVRINLTPYKNPAMQLRFKFTGLWPFYWAIDNMRVYVPQPKDVGPLSLVLPANDCNLAATTTLKLKITNYGTAGQSGFKVGYRVNGNSPVEETYTGNLAQGASNDFTFATPVDMSNPGVFKIKFWTRLIGDADSTNDTLVGTVLTRYPNGFPIQEFTSFDGSNLFEVTPGWKEARSLKGDGSVSNWTRSSPAQQVGFGTVSAKVNLFGKTLREWIISPSFKPSAVTGLVFKCALTDWNSNQNDFMGFDDTLKVKVSTNCGTTWRTIFFLNRTSGLNNQLKEFIVPLAQYAGQDIKLAFYATDGNQDNEEDYDIHIDDIAIETLPNADVGVVAIKSPVSNCGLTNSAVTVSIRNFGAVTQRNFAVKYQVNNLTVVSEIFADSVRPNQTKDFTFNALAPISAVGIYKFASWTAIPEDIAKANDSTKNYLVENSFAINTFPYNETFENGPGGWKVGGNVPSWELGTPQKTIINSPGEGSISWVTGGVGTGTYNSNENSYVLGPCFNFSNLLNPVFEMKVWWHSEAQRDGAQLQYSVNGGLNWRTAGKFNDPNNWYNTNTVTNLSNGPVFANPANGWSGGVGTNDDGSGGWVTARNFIKLAAGEPVVKFRIAFGANSVFFGDGFGFDKISIYEGPTKDIELQAITSPTLGNCQFGPNFPIKISMVNKGTQAVTNFPVYYQINALPPHMETITASIDTNQTYEYEFATKFDFVTPGIYNIRVWSALPADDIKDNDSLLVHRVGVYSNGLDTLQFGAYNGSNISQVFPGWHEARATPIEGDVSNWTRSNLDQTVFFGTSTAKINLSSIVNREWLISPQITCEPTTRLSFNIAKTKANETIAGAMGIDDSLVVRISTNCGASWTTLRYFNKDSTITTTLRKVRINLGAYAGQKIIIGFYGSDGKIDNLEDCDIHINKVLILPSPANDLAMAGLVSPVDPCGLSAAQVLKVKVVNNGASAQSVYQVWYQVNSSPPVSQDVAVNLVPDQETEISFTTPYNFTQPGIYRIKVWTKLTGDAVSFNDTSRFTLQKYGAPTAPVTFNGYGGTNLPLVTAGWSEAKGAIPVTGNSVWDALTFGSNTVARAPIAGGSINAWLLSPVIRLQDGNKLRFKAALRIPGTNSRSGFDTDDRVIVWITANCGQNWTKLLIMDDTLHQTLDETFNVFDVDLSAYQNQEVRIGFQAIDGTRADSVSDFLLDDVQIVNPNSFTDMSAFSWVSPGPVLYVGQTVDVIVRLKNVGTTAVDIGYLEGYIDETNYSGDFTTTISPNGSRDIYLGTYTPTGVGVIDGMAIISNVPDDFKQLNDTLRFQSSVLVGTDPLLASGSDLKAYPNPAHNLLFVKTLAPDRPIDEIRLLNVLGQRVEVPVRKIDSGKIKIDLENVANGLYQLQVFQDGRMRTIHIVKD